MRELWPEANRGKREMEETASSVVDSEMGVHMTAGVFLRIYFNADSAAKMECPFTPSVQRARVQTDKHEPPPPPVMTLSLSLPLVMAPSGEWPFRVGA